jgi:hypothetical protein
LTIPLDSRGVVLLVQPACGLVIVRFRRMTSRL